MTVLTVADLTQSTLAGTGVFDALMRANKAHLDAEFDKNRIKGSEYATVYLGSVQAVMQTALSFLLAKNKLALELDLMAQQILLAQVEVQKATAELAQIQAQTLLITAQKAQVTQETANAVSQGLQILAQTLRINAEKDQAVAQTSVLTQQRVNLVAEALNIPKQGCKLDAEFEAIKADSLKTGSENSLLTQKIATEKAQTGSANVEDNSVIGRQKLLYKAQTDGFKRDAEQKAAKVMVDTWSVRRSTDMDTAPVSDGNKLSDAYIGQAVGKLLTGLDQ